MIDRLLSGAGALSHAADGLVRTFARGGTFGHQPVGLLIAGGLVVATIALGVQALENSGSRTPTEIAAGAIPGADHGDRVYATISGGLAGNYVETYVDDDGNGRQDPGEHGVAWNYFLVDPASHAGVTFRSQRPPPSVYTLAVAGTVVEDAAYVAEDMRYFDAELQEWGLTLDPSHYIDATGDATSAAVHDLAQPLPAVGTLVSLSASRSVGYLNVCSSDPNADGVCADDEVDLYDVFVYDPLSKRAITVLTEVSPEFAPMSVTGTLRRSPDEVTEATTADGISLADIGISVSPTYLLTDEALADPRPLFAGAIGAALLAAIVAVGVAAGYVRFRPLGPAPMAGPGLALGERIPVRVTGLLRGPTGLIHVREAAADLLPFEVAAASAEPAQHAQPAALPDVVPGVAPALVVERRGRPEGVAVGRGELQSIESGVVRPLRGDRPAVRVTAGTGQLLLSFDTSEDRDRAAAALAAELEPLAAGPGPAHGSIEEA